MAIGGGMYSLSPKDWDKVYGHMSGTGAPGGIGGVRLLNPIEQATQAGQAVKAGMDAAGMGSGASASASTSTGAGAAAPAAAGPVPGMPATVTGPDSKAATDAAMARAKDRVGLATRGALSGLQAQLGSRGMLGSGTESRATASVANQGLQELADVNREQTIKESDQAQRNAELAYTGQIQQRGQDITGRGQDINAQLAREGRFQSQQQQMADMIMSALKSQLY